MKSAAARLVSYTTKFGDRAKFVGDPPPNKFGDLPSKFGDRPPIPGSEEGSKIFLEVAPAHPLPLMGHSERALNLEQSARLEKTMSPKPASESRDRGFEPEGSADVTPPFSESNSNQSTPAYVRWAENLSNLLSDPDGVELYRNYLKNENVVELLDFWFACQGLKKLPTESTEKIFQLIKVINRKFLRSRLVPVEEKTRKEIQERIAAKDTASQDIFDAAQREVEDRMTRTTYRNFMGSEAYLNYVQHMQLGESDLSAKGTGSHSTSSSISGKGPVHDDSGHFSFPVEAKSRVPSMHPAAVPTDNTSDSTSGISDSSSIVPLQQHQQQQQQHNNTANQNTSVEDMEFSQLVQSMSALPTLHEHSELDLTDEQPHSNSLLGLTSQSLIITQRRRHVVKPEAQAGIYLQSSRPVHPYHAYNSAYNPVSRQDSELQSLSSDAHTTDDNMSSFTESSSHYSYRQITSKKHIRRQLRKAHEQSRHNRENIQTQHSQQAFIPRTSRIPTEASNQLPPAEFAAILIQKLEKVKRDQEINEKLNRKLADDSHSMVSQNSSMAEILRADILRTDMLRTKEPPVVGLQDESDQSILDDHVSRVWTDKTPLRSPGDPAGRPRSPGYRSKSALTAPMGPPHRTLPGRGHRAQVRRPPMPNQPPMYHQDLAYYEVDRLPGRADARGPPPQGVRGRPEPSPAPRLLDGNTSRVMEWMQEVERHQGGQQDQKSQSSRSNNKTSPRSSRPKPGHRSASQERMSTSWTGHPGHPSNQYLQQSATPLQLEEAKRRLMMVGHAPNVTHHGPNATHLGVPGTHSNNSTLRKVAKPAAAGAPPSEYTVAVYTFSHEKDPMPYRIRIPSKAVTLRAVKDLLPKKGAFRFYFKTEVEGEACYEEETEDSNLVPLWDTKVLVQCRIMD